MSLPIPPLAVGKALARRSLDLARLSDMNAPTPVIFARLVDAAAFTRCPRCSTSGMTWALADRLAVRIGCACGWACHVALDPDPPAK